VFAWSLAVGSTLWLLLTTNWLAATLSAVAIFFYVVIYTMLLKRRTEQNIVWGGIAGCFVLIGWSAVTGSLTWTPSSSSSSSSSGRRRTTGRCR
jgi:protoheme IX farnesyltransferase